MSFPPKPEQEALLKAAPELLAAIKALEPCLGKIWDSAETWEPWRRKGVEKLVQDIREVIREEWKYLKEPLPLDDARKVYDLADQAFGPAAGAGCDAEIVEGLRKALAKAYESGSPTL